ncbi:MAG: ABC transporter ATP-binding protein [Cyclobacteriaceae bacterium]
MKTYLRILSYAKPYYTSLPVYSVFILLHVLVDILNFTLFVPLLDTLFKEENSTIFPTDEISIGFINSAKDVINNSFQETISAYGTAGALAYICIAMLVTNFLTNFFFYLSQRILAKSRSKIMINLRSDLYYKINRLHISYFSNQNRGDLISKMTNDMQEIERTIVNSVRTILRDPFKLVAIFIYLFIQDAQLTFFCLGVMPFAALAIGIISKKLKKLSNSSQSILGQILGTVDETIGGIRIVKAFNTSSFMQSKFAHVNNQYGQVLKKMSYRQDLASPLSQFIGVVFVAIILFYGGYRVLSSDTSTLSAAEFLTFLLLFVRVLDPVKAIAAVISDIQRGLVAGNRVFDVIDTTEQIQDSNSPVSFTNFENEIKLQNISFAYEEKDVLSNIDFTIQKGKTIALVGPSGGGKSTLMDMIPRFYDPQSGTVSIDGTNIKNIRMKDLRSQLAIVTQEAVLFNDTVYNNIAFGLDCTQQEIEEAAKIANAHAFISEMENGYHTEVGDRGVKLSGGQRQRITIARAILKNPPILLLDEATSALDSESEKLVQEALNNLMKNRTTLVIAHRLSTIQHADEIIVIENGCIIEKGTHNELLKRGGMYKRLQEIQHT